MARKSGVRVTDYYTRRAPNYRRPARYITTRHDLTPSPPQRDVVVLEGCVNTAAGSIVLYTLSGLAANAIVVDTEEDATRCDGDDKENEVELERNTFNYL